MLYLGIAGEVGMLCQFSGTLCKWSIRSNLTFQALYQRLTIFDIDAKVRELGA
jgi:hypothetical protein